MVSIESRCRKHSNQLLGHLFPVFGLTGREEHRQFKSRRVLVPRTVAPFERKIFMDSIQWHDREQKPRINRFISFRGYGCGGQGTRRLGGGTSDWGSNAVNMMNRCRQLRRAPASWLVVNASTPTVSVSRSGQKIAKKTNFVSFGRPFCGFPRKNQFDHFPNSEFRSVHPHPLSCRSFGYKYSINSRHSDGDDSPTLAPPPLWRPTWHHYPNSKTCPTMWSTIRGSNLVFMLKSLPY